MEIKQTEPARPRCIARDFIGFRIAEPLRSRTWNRSDTTIQLHKHETSNHWPSGEPPEDLRPVTEDQPDIEETLVHRSALLDFSEQSSVSLSDSRVPVGKKLGGCGQALAPGGRNVIPGLTSWLRRSSVRVSWRRRSSGGAGGFVLYAQRSQPRTPWQTRSVFSALPASARLAAAPFGPDRLGRSDVKFHLSRLFFFEKAQVQWRPVCPFQRTN